MSITKTTKTDDLISWLGDNAFWNKDLLEVKQSLLGGVGVFWKLADQTDPNDDKILLRIPKSNILSPKNSFIFNLLTEYEPEEPAIDFTKGMHAVVVSFLYEKSLGERSPWHRYIESFEIKNTDDMEGLPLCLWDEKYKNAMFNTELDLLNMLDLAELIQFFTECVNFAKTYQNLVDIPSELKLESGKDIDEKSKELRQFGRCVQAVISRAFTVDKYHGLSLVPGADLFNHMSPTFHGDSIIERENVHFVCDDDEDLCEICGEVGCAHNDSESEDEDEVDEEMKEEEEQEEDGDEGDEEEDEMDDLIEPDVELSADSEDSEGDEESSDEEEQENEEDQEDQSKPITLEQIEQMEHSDADTNQDEDEVSTLSMEDEDGLEDKDVPEVDIDLELAAELADGSKCCDILLSQPAAKEYEYELFNTYGNELSNPYLLQKYSFVSEGNPNNNCVLTLQMLQWLKKEKQNKRKQAILDQKLEWYEAIGFEMVNEFVIQVSSKSCGDDCEDDCGDGCGDGCEDGCEDDHGDEGAIEVPESWQLSPRVACDGEITIQTKALLNLLVMPFKVFLFKIAQAPSESKMFKRVQKYLLEAELHKDARKLISKFVEQRLARYKDTKVPMDGPGRMIQQILAEEKEILSKYLRQQQEKKIMSS